jgi:hypothetical protein
MFSENFLDQMYYSRGDHAAFVNEQLENSGESKEWEVVLATDTTLLLDYDSPNVPEQFFDVMRVLTESLGYCGYHLYKSRSGNTHVIVTLPVSMPAAERIAWQAAFGSDYKRESLHLLSTSRGDTNLNLLVMRKDRDKGLNAADVC